MQITPTPLPPILPRILLLLTFVTGIVDSVSVLALGRVFTANMTGNIVVIGFAMAGVPEFSLPRSVDDYCSVLRESWLYGAARPATGPC